MYSNYCRHSLLCTKYFVCVRVYVCYELSMSINIVQCSLHKLKKKKKKANRLVTRIQSFSAFLIKLVFRHTQPTTFSSHERI